MLGVLDMVGVAYSGEIDIQNKQNETGNLTVRPRDMPAEVTITATRTERPVSLILGLLSNSCH